MTAIASHPAPLAASVTSDDEGDAALLRRYLREGDRDAFTQLVQRYLAMVYAAARRMLRPDHLADVEDVTQAVFIVLARKAGTIRPGTSLAAWLYSATRMTAANARRNALRRRRRELEAGESMRQQRAVAAPASSSSSSASSDSITWAEIEPELDAALSRLRPGDREAIVLRFLASHTLREVGDAVGISEDAARVRVNRALVRLRRLMGASVPAVSIATALDAGAAHAAATVPAHLAMTIAASALAPAAGTTTAALAGATAATVTPAGAKIAGIGIAAVMMVGVGTAAVVAVVRSSVPPATKTVAVATPPRRAELVTPASAPASTQAAIPANSPRGITLSILRAAAAGDRKTMRGHMNIDNELEQRCADAAIEYLIAEGRYDATVAAKFPGGAGAGTGGGAGASRGGVRVSRLDEKISQIAAASESVAGDRGALTGTGGVILSGYVRARDGQWKMTPSIALLEDDPPAMLEPKLAGTKAISIVFDNTAAEIDAGFYPTRAAAEQALGDRVNAIMPPSRRSPSTAATTPAPTKLKSAAAPAARSN